jgi:small subunit ribosomal protein S16
LAARKSHRIEVVGIYSPVATPKAAKLDHARIEHWMKNGAQPSATVARLMKTYPAVVEPVAAA